MIACSPQGSEKRLHKRDLIGVHAFDPVSRRNAVLSCQDLKIPDPKESNAKNGNSEQEKKEPQILGG